MALTASSRTLQKHVGNGAIQANIHTWIPIADTLCRAYHEECQQVGDVSKWSPAHEAHTFGQFIAVDPVSPEFLFGARCLWRIRRACFDLILPGSRGIDFLGLEP